MALMIFSAAEGRSQTAAVVPGYSPSVPSSSNGPVDYYYLWSGYSGTEWPGGSYGGTACTGGPGTPGNYSFSILGVVVDSTNSSTFFGDPSRGSLGQIGYSYTSCGLVGYGDVGILGNNGTWQYSVNLSLDGTYTINDPYDYFLSSFPGFYSLPDYGGYFPPNSFVGTNAVAGLWSVAYYVAPETNAYDYPYDADCTCSQEVWGWDSGFYYIHVHLSQGATAPLTAIPPLPNYPVLGAVGTKIPHITPPFVTIFTPAAYQIYSPAPATVPITVNAQDVNPYGSITSVNVYEVTRYIGSATRTVNPYSFNGYLYTFFWTNVPAGTWTLTAVATDNNGVSSASAPVAIEVGSVGFSYTFPQAAAGYYHSLALKPDGTVRAWGQNTYGQVGDGTFTTRSNPVSVSGLTGIKMVAAGAYHSLALASNGTAWSWGGNATGQLGGPYYTYGSNQDSPVQVSQSSYVLSNIVYIAGGELSSYAITSDSNLWAWGDNDYGQLGSGYTGGTLPAATQISGLTNVLSVAAGDNHVLALTSSGAVYSWGANSYGQLGNGTTNQSASPGLISGLNNIVAISAGGGSSYALDSSGNVWVWGYGDGGELGLGTTNNEYTPVANTNLTGISAISAGHNYCFALANNGTLEAWGINGAGELGDGTTTQRLLPISVSFSDGSQAFGMAAGAGHTLSVQRDATLRSWGLNFYGELGRSISGSSTPTPGAITGF
jgi:alpha-tubulin suppressor-like RCC1 family protein